MKKTFCIGALGYGLLEILWRGRTHPSMLLAGGAALCAIKRLCRKPKHPLVRAVQCGAVITGIELLAGMIFNRDKQVWDYSHLRGNLWGQICPLYSLFWILLSLPFVIYYNLDKEVRKWKS